MTPTCSCGRPVKDQAVLCAGCTDRLARDLGDIGALAEELQTTRLRQSRTGGQATGVLSRTFDRPLPWDERAAEAAEILRSTVVGWVRLVVEERGTRWPSDHMTGMGAFLLANLNWLRHHPDGDEAADELRHAVTLAYRAVDTAPDRLYIGPCDPQGEFGESECPTDLYARESAAEVACRCGLVWNVAHRREYLLDAAQDQLVTAADLSKFLTAYGAPLTAERIRQWAARGQLTAHGHTPAGNPLYRVSEAVERLSESTRRRSA